MTTGDPVCTSCGLPEYPTETPVGKAGQSGVWGMRRGLDRPPRSSRERVAVARTRENLETNRGEAGFICYGSPA